MNKSRVLSRMNRCEDRMEALGKWYIDGLISEREFLESMKDEKRKFTYFKHMLKGDV